MTACAWCLPRCLSSKSSTVKVAPTETAWSVCAYSTRSYRTSMRYEEGVDAGRNHCSQILLCARDSALRSHHCRSLPRSRVSPAQFLSKPKFSSVEKIKTIGSTYMAAAGLTQSPVGDDRKVIFMTSFKFNVNGVWHTVWHMVWLPAIPVIFGSLYRKWRCPTLMCAPWLSLPLPSWASWSWSTHTLSTTLNSGLVSALQVDV